MISTCNYIWNNIFYDYYSPTSTYGQNAIEINTNKYSLCKKQSEIEAELQKIKDCAIMGKKLGMRILAGHALNYTNVKLIKDIMEIEELNIGHSIIARAALVGLERAVREMKDLIKRK